MNLPKSQSGFAPVETFLIVVILAMISFTGYKVLSYKNSTDKTNKSLSGASSLPAAKTIPSAPSIVNASDLNTAESTLNQVNPDDNAAQLTQLNSQLSTF